MQPTPIVQFGTSRFLQAHADFFVSDAMAEGQDVGPITVVQSSGDAARAERLKGMVGGYPVRIEGMQDGTEIRETVTVRSVARTLSTATDWETLTRIFVEEARIVLSNTGDRGYAPQPADTGKDFDQSMSYPAKLLCLLRARHAAGAAPIQIMPMELVADNGAVLKARVMELAQADSAALRAYLDTGVTWVNSLVDRIVSQPLEPAGAVAEPYALWAIEETPGLVPPCRHPAIRIVPALAEIEALKLFVLNLGHTFLADRWLQAQGADDVFVRHLMADETERAALTRVLQDEVAPAFTAAGLGDQFGPYVATTLDRFANPFLDHRIADISQNHAQKVERRIAAMVDWARRQGDTTPKPLLSEIIRRNAPAAG